MHISIMLVFWSLASLVRNSVVLAVYLLFSVACFFTVHEHSDWATTDIPSEIKSMWYRFSRRDSDYCIECSEDGIAYRQMRIFHMWEGAEKITYGIYAASPTTGSFKATFSNMQIIECQWKSDADWREEN